MKRIFLILAVILILLTGCNNSTELSDTPAESIPAIVITENVTDTTKKEDPKRTTDNADAASSFSASKETETTEPEETASEPKPSATTEQLAKTEQAEENFNRTPSANVTSNVSKCIKNNIANEKEIAIKIFEKINELRYLAGDGNMEFLNGLSEYAKYRSEQIVFDFSHNTTAQREAATTLQYGTYIDPKLYGAKGKPYFSVEGMEAIAYGAYIGTEDEIAENFTLQIHNSNNHWSYVGNNSYKFIGVGVTRQNASWYVCIIVTRENTDNI